ncbi:uncharacterized protein LOC118467518 isoform X2 [Anopheles albimanus]|uniref:uncharacterized protein LOC118467518 isoform X2 n=1 Tax=Anopheles albimanus TaxID=7167 RepID=UPI00163E962F|nr:uncharacterized protein LOC118467518 isoform X2 [Anopheles albimanus]
MAPKRNLINCLPDEVLSMVFTRLDFESVKNASLTCRRWNNVIFEGGCAARFLLNISHESPALSKKDSLKSLEARIRLLTKHTKRRYRNLQITVVTFTEMVFLTIWKTIHPKITNNIRYLYIGFIGACMSDLLPLLIDSIPSLLQLETLIVAEELMMDCDGIYSKIHQSNIPTIRSESLKKLSMTCNYRYTVVLPQLEIFEGALSVLNLPDGCSQSLILPNLKQLHVLVMNDDSINPTVFRRMPCLNFIRWDVPLDEALFIAICETCPSLTVLHLYKELIFTDLSLFDHLRKLAGLRRLSFPAINKQLFYDFSKFNHLEELNFGNNEILAVTLLSLPKSVRKLGLLVYPINERNLMEIIACSLTKLTELQLIIYGGSASQEMLKMLPSLKQLKIQCIC